MESENPATQKECDPDNYDEDANKHFGLSGTTPSSNDGGANRGLSGTTASSSCEFELTYCGHAEEDLPTTAHRRTYFGHAEQDQGGLEDQKGRWLPNLQHVHGKGVLSGWHVAVVVVGWWWWCWGWWRFGWW
jgi:hypothetical protein